jgi:hypothetical protein
MVVADMAVSIVDCAAVFDAVTTILLLLSTAATTNTIAPPPLTAAAQSTVTIAKAIVGEQQTLAINGGRQHRHHCH